MVGQTNADCDGLSPVGYGGGRPYEISRNRRLWTNEIARVLIAKQIENIHKFKETGETYPEITEKFQNQIKTTKNHREKEREREKNVPGKLKRE